MAAFVANPGIPMRLKSRYTFLYLPDDQGGSRLFHLPRWALLAMAGTVLLLVLGTALYGVDVRYGGAWRPGGSRLAHVNGQLRGTIHHLEGRVNEVRVELAAVRAVQIEVASAVNLPLPGAETYEAGVGGRQDLLARPAEVPGVEPGSVSLAEVDRELALMLRRARIQQQGYAAMLDTLDDRGEVRNHIPSIRPVDMGWLSSRFGFRGDPFTGKQTFHRGLDFSVPVGSAVRVTGDGRVAAVQTQRGFGRVIKVDHGNGVITVYAHLDRALVAKGDVVTRGQIIARSGNSGRSSAPHLHYEIRVAGRPVNPASYILDSYARN